MGSLLCGPNPVSINTYPTFASHSPQPVPTSYFLWFFFQFVVSLNFVLKFQGIRCHSNVLLTARDKFPEIWTAIRKYCRLGGWNNRHLFPTVLETGKSKIKVTANLILCEDPLAALQSATWRAGGRWKNIERDLELKISGVSSSYQGTNPSWRLHHHAHI